MQFPQWILCSTNEPWKGKERERERFILHATSKQMEEKRVGKKAKFQEREREREKIVRCRDIRPSSRSIFAGIGQILAGRIQKHASGERFGFGSGHRFRDVRMLEWLCRKVLKLVFASGNGDFTDREWWIVVGWNQGPKLTRPDLLTDRVARSGRLPVRLIRRERVWSPPPPPAAFISAWLLNTFARSNWRARALFLFLINKKKDDNDDTWVSRGEFISSSTVCRSFSRFVKIIGR